MKLSGVLQLNKGSKELAKTGSTTPVVLESPLGDADSPKLGFTLLHGDSPSPSYLKQVFKQAAAKRHEVNLITVTVPVYSFPSDVAAKIAGSLDCSHLLECEHLRVSNISKDLRNDIVNRLIQHYEQEGDLPMVERLVGVSSSMNLNQLCAQHPSVVDVIWQQNSHLAVISHLSKVDGVVEEASTMYRGGLDSAIVNRHGTVAVVLPEICHRPILSLVRERAFKNEVDKTQSFTL